MAEKPVEEVASRPPLPPIQYEYLDHTADIQIKASSVSDI
jgi:hypothetical protein